MVWEGLRWRFQVTPSNTITSIRALSRHPLSYTRSPAFSMDRGQHSQGINRRMRNAASGAYMRYNLYSDPAYSRRWTDQRAGQVRGNSGATGSIAFPVYGELTFDGSAVTGRYEDSITVTVEF